MHDETTHTKASLATATHTAAVPVIEEALTVSKRLVTTADVELRKHVELEDAQIDLVRTDRTFDIERRSVGMLLDELPASVYSENGSTIYRVIEEVPVVVTKFRVVEEIIVTPSEKTTSTPTVIPLHKEHVDIIRRPHKINDPLV